MQRVFHVPAHLSYVSKLDCDRFAPVRSPSGSPLRVSDLLALRSWDFFDVLHLHTVELSSVHELETLSVRLRKGGKGLVFTLHDLVPNIEADRAAFNEKTRVVSRTAACVITLTQAAADLALDRFGVEASVAPHGFAAPPALIARRATGGSGLLAFGALRPNRDLVGLARAWHLLNSPRPPLQIVLRSLGSADRERYAGDLVELERIAHAAPDLTVETVSRVLSASELAQRCEPAMALIMPYRSITHSGQLELARDLGLAAVVPDVPTVRAQLDETAGVDHPCVWFPPTALNEPAEFARYLQVVRENSDAHIADRDWFARYWIEEERELLDHYGTAYRSSCE